MSLTNEELNELFPNFKFITSSDNKYVFKYIGYNITKRILKIFSVITCGLLLPFGMCDKFHSMEFDDNLKLVIFYKKQLFFLNKKEKIAFLIVKYNEIKGIKIYDILNAPRIIKSHYRNPYQKQQRPQNLNRTMTYVLDWGCDTPVNYCKKIKYSLPNENFIPIESYYNRINNTFPKSLYKFFKERNINTFSKRYYRHNYDYKFIKIYSCYDSINGDEYGWKLFGYQDAENTIHFSHNNTPI